MREFAQTLSDFTKGLRPDTNTPRNSGYATELYNSRCGVAGLEVPPLIAYPISGAPAVSWPLPQLIKIHDLALTDTGLYFSRYAAGTLTISKVNSDYSLTSVFTKASINQRFTIADFGYYQIWAVPGLVIKRQVKDDLSGYEWTEILVNGSAPPVNCVCNFRGQLIAGLYTSATDVVGATKDNLVVWSEIGSVNPAVMFSQDYSFIDRARTIAAVNGSLTRAIYTETDDGFTSHIFDAVPPNVSIFPANGYQNCMGRYGGISYDSYLRFRNITIPVGATILSAYIRFVSNSNYTTVPVILKCYFNDVANVAAAPTTGPQVEALAQTAGVAWTISETWSVGSSYNTPDLTTDLQSIVDKSGWASGNAVMVLIRDIDPSVDPNWNKLRSSRSAGYFGEENWPQLIITYTYTSTYPRTGDPMQPYKRTSGNYRTRPTSTVHRVLPLGNGVMVYCSDRIFYLKAASMPEPTFGIVEISEFGIPSTFCAEGDDKEHVFIDTFKNIWRMVEGQKPKYLGYREYIGALTGTLIISKGNPTLGDYYISNGTKTYLLTSFGLSEWFQYPTSLVWEDANKRLIGPIAVSTDVSAYMASTVFDFGVRALKTITVMEMGATGQVMTANVDYKYKVTDSAFTASRFKTASNFGAVTPIVTGTEFKFRVKGADYTKFDLDYLTVRYKYVDKRMIRGVYATDAKVLSRTGR